MVIRFYTLATLMLKLFIKTHEDSPKLHNPAFMIYLLLTFILSCFSSSMPLNSLLTIFRVTVSFFLPNRPTFCYQLCFWQPWLYILHPPKLWSIDMTPVLLVVSRKLLEMTFFSFFGFFFFGFSFVFNEHMPTYPSCCGLLPSGAQSWDESFLNVSFLLGQRSLHYPPLFPWLSEFTTKQEFFWLSLSLVYLHREH